MNYDLSKLKPDGSHYLVIGFSLPYCLHVPDGNYRVKIVSQDELITTQIIFEKKKRTLSKRTLLPGTKEIEKFADRKGSFNYTTALVYIPVKVDSCDLYSDFRLMNEFVQAKHSWYREQAIDATNRFISVYRYCTGECHVRLLAGHDVWFDFSAAFLFNENAPNAKRSSFKGTVTPHFNIHDIIPLVPDIPDNVLHEIRNRLISTDKIPIAEELMLNAYDLLDQGNYRLAVIEAETAFEAAILKFLRDEYQSQDITLKKIENTTSFGQLLNRREFIDAISRKGKLFDKEQINRKEWHKNVWSIRGNLVHGRVDDVSYDIASKAIESIEKTLEYLLERPRTNPWRYSFSQ